MFFLIYDMFWHKNGYFATAGAVDALVKIWNSTTGQFDIIASAMLVYFSYVAGQLITTLKHPSGHGVYSLASPPQDGNIMFAGLHDGTIAKWDISAGLLFYHCGAFAVLVG